MNKTIVFPVGERRRVGIAAGLLAFAVGLLQYRSYASRVVLGRWSHTYAMFAGVTLLIVALLVIFFLRRRSAPPGAWLVDLLVLFWGFGYLWQALDSSDNGGAVFDGVVLGSAVRGAVLLYGASIACTALVVVRWAWRRRADRGTKIALLVAAVGVALAAVEIGFRLRAVFAPTPQGFPTYSSQIWFRRNVRFNAAGFRDQYHSAGPHPGVRRLLVVGDKYAFGLGMDRTEDRFGEVLTGALTKTTGAQWESVNASFPDRDTRDEIGMLRRALVTAPDVVVLIYAFDDIEYLSPVTVRAGVLTEWPRTLWEWVHPLRIGFKNSFLVQEIVVRARRLPASERQGPGSDPYADSGVVARHLVDVKEFVAIADSAGARTGVVPFDLSILSSDERRARYARFVRWAAGAGIPVWPLDQAFDRLPRETLVVNRLDRSPNALANRLAAQAVLPQILAALGRSSR